MNRDYLHKEEKSLIQAYSQLPISVVQGIECELITNDGKKIIDFYGGHAVVPLGYGLDEYLDVINTQMKKLLFQSNLLPLDIRANAASQLLSISPKNLKKVFFVNSGSEANENALKIACHYKKRKKILSISHAFHGRTAAAAAVTWGSESWYGFPSKPFEVEFIPRNNSEIARKMINSDVAAVIVEPIQGVAGAFDLSEEFLRTIRDECNDHSALMIVDEVQSGMGRSGEYFAIQNFNIEPDIMTAAKSLGGGLPCSVIFISNLLDETIKKGDLGSTFGGNPVICSAIEFVIQYIKEKNLLNNVIEREKEIRDLCITGPVNGIQGKGLLLGLITDHPAHEIQKKLLKKNILTGLSSDPSVLRLLPPLVLQSKHIEKLSQSLTEI